MIPCYDFQPPGVNCLPADVQMNQNDSFKNPSSGVISRSGVTKRWLTCCPRWCRPHKYRSAPRSARSNGRRRGLPRPSSSGSPRSGRCRCSRRRWPPCGASGSSTERKREKNTESSSYSELGLQIISLFVGSSSAEADGTQTVASQQTYCLWYTRAASCRKQPKTNSAPHRAHYFHPRTPSSLCAKNSLIALFTQTQ